ncbi:MAG: TetR/AcrR family transcriptional regulator [Actinobacteria bacterium]|nr:TetR/AcrR family transcriptional regulator [Actinomycetota bacterium]MCZ6631694.1 TetR/AcrR family transcriptional regulator [Actinomycetota bacterium]MCZ6739091.1 TetR/AcrR family transcriptional regulator [Actinomycetota bacterium]
MRSVDDEDRTTQARIRDVAIERFPKEGFAGTTVRAIAADAGVSPALVLHHFGSKKDLHRACDEYVVRMIGETKREAMRTGSYRQAGAIATTYQLFEPVLRYLAWTLSTGTGTADRFFDDLLNDVTAQLVEGQETGFISEIHGDPRKQAAILVAMQLGGLILHQHLSRAMGVDTLTSEGLMASAPYTLQVFSGNLFNTEVIAQAKKAIEQLQTTGDTDQEANK